MFCLQVALRSLSIVVSWFDCKHFLYCESNDDDCLEG